MMYSGRTFGICLGASTLSLVQLGPGTGGGPAILRSHSLRHDGDPKATLKRLLRPHQLRPEDRVAVTGRKFRRLLSLSSLSEPEAVELAYEYFRAHPDGRGALPAGDGMPECCGIPECRAIVSLGGETLMVYVLDDQGRIKDIHTGNKCASGTGEFFIQQLRRMDVSLEEAARWTVDTPPYAVSGRCSVFCKSDCTHATNSGVPRARVTAGLCQMMAAKVLQLLKRVPSGPIMLVGGSTRNQMLIHNLKAVAGPLIVPPRATCFEALGVALWASRSEPRPFPGMADADLFREAAGSFATLPPLSGFAHRVRFSTRTPGTIR